MSSYSLRQRIQLFPLLLFAVFYLFLSFVVIATREAMVPFTGMPAAHSTIAIFGASGTAGDGILKAALADPTVEDIRVITRRTTPRMEQGVSSGKLTLATHMDYMDYEAVRTLVEDVDAVYWAIGASSIGMDEKTYGRIHVDFPAQFVREWLEVSTKDEISFHYISSSDISEDSSAMWAREKVRAEKTLFALADGTKLKVIAYRPDYIGPTEEEAHLGQDLLYWFFAPVGAAVPAQEIGEAMIEITVRGDEYENSDKVGTRSIRRLSDAYRSRVNED